MLSTPFYNMHSSLLAGTIGLPSLGKPPLSGKAKPRKIPDYLVREVIDGVPFYYPEFRAVLNKTKTLDDIRADSTLQWTLKENIGDLVKSQLDAKRYRFGRGEVGVHLGRGDNVGLDMAVFDKQLLTPEKIGARYTDVPPIVVIEIDIQIEHSERHANLFEEYVLPKIKRLLDFGTQRFLWIFSKSKTILIAEPGKKWYFQPWDQDVELFSGITFNVQEILKKEGIL